MLLGPRPKLTRLAVLVIVATCVAQSGTLHFNCQPTKYHIARGGGLGTPSDEVVVGPRRVAVTCRATGRLSSSDPADDLAEISGQHSRVALPDTLE